MTDWAAEPGAVNYEEVVGAFTGKNSIDPNQSWTDGDWATYYKIQSGEGIASAYDANLGWHEGAGGGSTFVPSTAVLPTITESQAQDLVGGQANVRAGDTFTINTATGDLVSLNGQSARSGTVTIGTAIVVNDGTTVAPITGSGNSYTAADITATQAIPRPPQSAGNSDWAAIVNAGQDTFGNAVFQEPLTTLAKAGAGVTAIAGGSYALVTVAAPAVTWFGGLPTEAKIIVVGTALRVATHGDVKAPRAGQVGGGAFTQMRPSITQTIIKASKKERRGPGPDPIP